jgi:hypothetical protein
VHPIERIRGQQLPPKYDVVDGDSGVCPGCISDVALARYVSRLRLIDRCDFCGGPSPFGVPLWELFRYMETSLATEWDDPVNEVGWATREGGWLIPAGVVRDSYDLMVHLGEPLGEKGALRDAFLQHFDHDWCPRDPYRLAHHEVLTSSWGVFSRYVKETSRYLFLSTGRSTEADSELVAPAAMLEELRVAIVNSGLIRRLPAGRELFRARRHKADEELATAAALGSPPAERAAASRMSAVGIPMFYGAEDLDTALAELRLEPDGRATVATWSTARQLPYLDLVDIDIPSIFDMTARGWRPWRRFLREFADDAAQPPDLAGITYVPTQIVTEFIRHEVLDSDGTPVRGIRYRSAVRAGGVSWALFVDAAGCVEAGPGWETVPINWLALDGRSVRHGLAAAS